VDCCCCAADAAIRVGSRSATVAGDFGADCCLCCCFVVVVAAVVVPRCMKRMFLVAPDSVRDAAGCCGSPAGAAAPPGRGRLVPAVAAAPEGDGGGINEPGFHIRMCGTEGSKSKKEERPASIIKQKGEVLTLDGFTHSMSNIALLVTVMVVMSPFFNSQNI